MILDKSELIEILTLFGKTFSKNNKLEVDQAENTLKELAKEFQKHFNLVFSAIKEDGINSDLKLSMILYLKNLINSKIEENTLPIEVILEILRNCIDMMLTVQFCDKNLKNLANFIKIMLSCNQIMNITDELQSLLMQYLNKVDSENKIKPLILLFDVIETSIIINNENSEIIKIILDSLNTISNFLLKKFEFLNFDNIVNQISEFLILVDLFENVFGCLYGIIVKTKKLGIFSSFLEYYQTNFLMKAIKLLCMTIPTISPTYIIFWTREREFDSKINLMKIRCLQFLSSIIASYKITINNHELVISINMLIEIFTNNLDFVLNEKWDYLLKMNEDSIDFPDFNYSPFIYYIIQFFVIVLTKEPVKSNFFFFSHKFTLNYLMPFFLFTSKEIDEMKNNYERYNDYITDLIEERKYRKIKTMTSQLIDKICVKYDGFGNFFVGYCIQLLEYTLKSNSIDQISNYPLLKEYYSERLIKGVTAEQKIESCFLLFSVLTHIITKSKKLLLSLKTFFENNISIILNITSEIVRSRICFFLGFYIDEIFLEEKDLPNVEKCIEYLLSNIFIYNTKNEGLAYMASDTLNDLVNSKNYKSQIEKVVLMNLNQLINTIDYIDLVLLFNIVSEIISNYKIDDSVLLYISKLSTTRILKEIKSTSLKNKKKDGHEGIINKCFEIIRNLCSKEDFVKKYIEEIESHLDPIFAYMKAPMNINFEDDLFFIIIKIFNFTQSVTMISKNLFVNLPIYYFKVNHVNREFFELICCYFKFAQELVNSNLSFQEFILNIFKSSLHNENYYDNPPMYCALLMQVWLQSIQNLDIQIFNDIFTLTMNELCEFMNLINIKYQLDDYFDYLRFANLLSIIYSAFIHYPISAFEMINNKGFNNHFINWTIVSLKCSQFNSYNIKIVIIGLCSLITSESNINNSELFKLLIYLLSFLHRQKSEESNNLKVFLMKDVDCNFIDDDLEDDNIDDEFIKTNKPKLLNECPFDEMTKFINCVSPFNKFDEYEIFHKSIIKLKHIKQNVVDHWLNKLNENEKLILNNIMSVRRIEVKNNNEIFNVPRKILKIKKPMNDNN